MRSVGIWMMMLLVTVVGGCVSSAAVGISGSGKNCYMDPGPEVAFGWDARRLNVEIQPVIQKMSETMDSLGSDELLFDLMEDKPGMALVRRIRELSISGVGLKE